MKKDKFWKLLIVTIVLAFVWIRLSPAIVWTIDSHERIAKYQERWSECYEYDIVYEWSWWSLRFVSVYPVCK